MPRLLLAGVGFLAFEALFIWLLGEKIYDFSYLNPVLWGMLALAAAGYFALGSFSRNWLSGFLLAGPFLIALYFVHVVWTTDIPAWAVGVLSARRRFVPSRKEALHADPVESG